MSHLIIGTAGHVDHGKTALIQALTGIDADRLAEEKRRGLTIDLGFAHLTLPDGTAAGIVDVPGHGKFIRNMLAGAGGVDLALLVVAADDGVMPQTREHLAILRLLGTPRGVVAITKADLAGPDRLAQVAREIRRETAGGFLQDAPILPVSARSGQGLDALIAALAAQARRLPCKDIEAPFRLAVDRVFTAEGFGTVVTGTALSGRLRAGDKAAIFPAEIHARVRGLQVHGQEVAAVFAGQRAAVNLAGIRREAVRRGDVLAEPGSLRNTRLLDVRLELLPGCGRTLTGRSRLRFHHGARDLPCRGILIGKDRLHPGETAYAQLLFEDDLAVKRGDRFVVRLYSPALTVGGGCILHPAPAGRRKNRPQALADMRVRDRGSMAENILLSIAEAAPRPAELEQVRRDLGVGEAAFRQALAGLVTDGEVIPLGERRAVHAAWLDDARGRAADMVRRYHRDHPLRQGIRREALLRGLLPDLAPELAEPLLARILAEGFTRAGQLVAADGFRSAFTDGQLALLHELEALFRGSFSPPSRQELETRHPDQVEEIALLLDAMLSDGTLVAVAPGMLFHRGAVIDAADRVRALISAGGRATLAQFRDALASTRKFALALLEYFDRRGYTKRVGDARVLTGREFPPLNSPEQL